MSDRSARKCAGKCRGAGHDDIELRDEADGDSWELAGVNPYGKPYAVSDHRGNYQETLAPYAFREHLSSDHTIPLLIQHAGRYTPVLESTGRSRTMTLSES